MLPSFSRVLISTGYQVPKMAADIRRPGGESILTLPYTSYTWVEFRVNLSGVRMAGAGMLRSTSISVIGSKRVSAPALTVISEW